MKYAALGLAFILELVAFAFFAGIAFTLNIDTPLQLAFAAVLFCLLIAFWGVYMSPKAPKKLEKPGYYAAKAGIYAVSAYSILELSTMVFFFAFVIAVVWDEFILSRL